MITHNLTASFNTKTNNNIAETIPENQASLFKQKITKSIKSAVPYIISCAGFMVGSIIIAYQATESISSDIIFKQGYGRYKCLGNNEMAMDESFNKMLNITTVTAVISTVLSPIAYMAYNTNSELLRHKWRSF